MRKAFTLVELLIVIAIIAILAAIAIPQYTKYVRKAAVASAQASFSSCLSAAQAAFADNGSTTYTCYLPGANTTEVKLKLNENGTLEGFVDSSNSSKVDDSISLSIKGHAVRCSINATANTITCSQG